MVLHTNFLYFLCLNQKEYAKQIDYSNKIFLAE